MITLYEGLLIIFTIVILFYIWMRHKYQYFSRRGFYFIKPLPIVGSFLPLVTQKQSFVEMLVGFYSEIKAHKYGGMFSFLSPNLLITDPEIIKEVTVKYFNHFSNRSSPTNDKVDPLSSRSLMSLQGDEWREMRNILSPAFTTSKLRGMFPLISQCGEQFARFLTTRPEADTSSLDLKVTFTRFASDVIASVAFGIESNAINNPQEEFFIFGQKIMNFSDGLRKFVIFGYMLFPKLMTFFNIPIMPSKITDFFRNIVKNTKYFREENNLTRPDVLQLLLNAQRGGNEHQDGDEDTPGTVGETEDSASFYKKHLAPQVKINKVITDDDIAAQLFLFFLAGSETVSSLLAFLTHHLAENPEIQSEIREEIEAAILENGGKVTYEAIQKLKFLDMAISETMRLYPSELAITRVCTKSFKIPGTELVIDRGTSIGIPVYALHHDQELFPNPYVFNPNRFSEINKTNIKPYTYLPFGAGPHNCIAMRLGLLEVKICMVFLLATCELKLSDKTQVPLQLSRSSFSLTADKGFWLLCVPRENCFFIDMSVSS